MPRIYSQRQTQSGASTTLTVPYDLPGTEVVVFGFSYHTSSGGIQLNGASLFGDGALSYVGEMYRIFENYYFKVRVYRRAVSSPYSSSGVLSLTWSGGGSTTYFAHAYVLYDASYQSYGTASSSSTDTINASSSFTKRGGSVIGVGGFMNATSVSLSAGVRSLIDYYVDGHRGHNFMKDGIPNLSDTPQLTTSTTYHSDAIWLYYDTYIIGRDPGRV